MSFQKGFTETHSGSALKKGEYDDPDDGSIARHREDGQGEDQGRGHLANQDHELS